MDKRKSIINVSVATFFRFFVLVSALVVRRFLIQYIGNAINGLNSLYESLIGFLAVAELGIGSAIAFCMYRPIVDKDYTKVAAIYQLFTKTYRVISIIILTLGVILIPFLPFLAKDYAGLNVNLGLTFFLMLISVVLSYVFSAKTSLINAYKNNYVTTAISSIGIIVQSILQVIVIVVTRSFIKYLICRVIAMLFQWLLTEIYVRKKHKNIIRHAKEKIDIETKKEIIKNIKAMFGHRIGEVLVNSADSIIISAFIGVVVLGKYSNYSTIATAMTSILVLVFTPLTSIIGHAYVSEREKTANFFEKFHYLNFALGLLFFLGYYAVIDELVIILFGNNLELEKSISIVITVNYFVQFMRRSTLLFRDATGTFYNDRWKPIVEGGLNVILSISLVVCFSHIGGDELAVVGVIVATIITNLSICYLVEPYVLYKHAFQKPVKKHLIKNYSYFFVFVAVLLVMDALMQTMESPWVQMIINGLISIALSLFVLVVTALLDKNIRKSLRLKRKNRDVKNGR